MDHLPLSAGGSKIVTTDYPVAAVHLIRDTCEPSRLFLDGSSWARNRTHQPDTQGNHMLEKFITLMLIGRDDEEGATAVEYGLMVALIAIVIIGAVTLLGGNLEALFSSIAGSI